MAIFEKETQRTLFGVGIGACAVIALRIAAPLIAAVARPLTKAIITNTMDGFERATHMLATAAETFQDLVAEARAERGIQVASPSAAAATASHEVN